MEMSDEVLSSVGAQDMDRSGYQMSDVDGVEVHWENDQRDIDALLRPGIDTPFSPSTFNSFEIDSMAENPILIDEEQDKGKSPPPPTPVSKRTTQPLC